MTIILNNNLNKKSSKFTKKHSRKLEKTGSAPIQRRRFSVFHGEEFLHEMGRRLMATTKWKSYKLSTKKETHIRFCNDNDWINIFLIICVFIKKLKLKNENQFIFRNWTGLNWSKHAVLNSERDEKREHS